MANKKVLFIGIGFYDYELSIVEEFKALGYEVDYFSEHPAETYAYRFYIRTNNISKIEAIRAKHSNDIVEKSGSDYDLVMIIKCEYFTIAALEKLKSKNPNARFVLYMWDSLTRFRMVESKFRFFDTIYSFDRFDCKADNRLIFHPLFYRNEYLHSYDNKLKTDYDLYHLGWCHSDRLKLIKEIAFQLDQKSLRYSLTLYAGYISYLLDSVFGGALKGCRKYLIFKPISAKENFKSILKSKVILDITHPDQTGLTMRTVEMIGAEKKLITTNRDVVNYDFYNPNNILIIDRENPVLDMGFFDTEYMQIPNEIKTKYSIRNWLKKMTD